MAKEQQNLRQQLGDSNVEMKKMEYLLAVKRMEIEQKDCSSKVDKLVEKFSWIANEKHLFGKSGTDYDFASCKPHKAQEELEAIQAQQSRRGSIRKLWKCLRRQRMNTMILCQRKTSSRPFNMSIPTVLPL